MGDNVTAFVTKGVPGLLTAAYVFFYAKELWDDTGDFNLASLSDMVLGTVFFLLYSCFSYINELYLECTISVLLCACCLYQISAVFEIKYDNDSNNEPLWKRIKLLKYQYKDSFSYRHGINEFFLIFILAMITIILKISIYNSWITSLLCPLYIVMGIPQCWALCQYVTKNSDHGKSVGKSDMWVFIAVKICDIISIVCYNKLNENKLVYNIINCVVICGILIYVTVTSFIKEEQINKLIKKLLKQKIN